MRFLHTSDWHLGRIFHGVHLTEDQSYIIDDFLACVKDTKPNGIIIAGDIYDRAVPPTEAMELLDETLSQIVLDLSIPVIIIAGNHDSPERLGFGNKFLARQGLHVVGTITGPPEPIIIEDKYGPVYFLPLPYSEPALIRERFQDPEVYDHELAIKTMIQHGLGRIPENKRKVCIAHAFIAGGSTTESERPLSVGGSSVVSPALFNPFNYTALGHLHNSQSAGGEQIRYPGSLLKYSFAEANQRKGINLVEINEAGEVSIEAIHLTPRRDVRIIEGYFKDILGNPESYGNRNDYLQIILQDEGPILDPMGQLRSIFPNILNISRPHFSAPTLYKGPAPDHRKLTETQLFSSFFEQMTGQALTEEQEAEFNKTMEEILREHREVSQ